MNNDEHTELHRRIRWRLSLAEQSLDLAINAANQARKLRAVDAAMREEFGGDIILLKGKLDNLAAMLT